MEIHRIEGVVRETRDLSRTAREVTLKLSQPLPYTPGAFVNVFFEKEGKRIRRAYTIASGNTAHDSLTLAIRNSGPEGASHLFFCSDVDGMPVSVMGPLGINTAEKITRPRVFLFAFGIGVSAARGLAEHLLLRPELVELTIVTGSRTEDEILYKEYFETLALRDPRVRVRFVVSRPTNSQYPYQGYIQDHVSDLDFSNATAYLCGQGSACETLRHEIRAMAPDTEFLIESFDS